MTQTAEKLRDTIIEDEHLTYLDDLRDSGVTNMFGAGEYLEADYNLNKREARTVLLYWMETFEDRQNER